MFGVSRFKGKTIVIAGAEHPLGASLCERLARFGAVVIAVGWTDTTLLDIAARAPGKIEPLMLSQGRRDVLELLREAWGDEPLNVYIDLIPIMNPARHDMPHAAFAQSAGLASALAAGMRAGRARGIMAIPYGHGGAPSAQARTAGYTALVRRLSRDLRPARVLGLALPDQAGGWTTPATVSAGDTVMTLAHDVSRGIKAGSIVEWAMPDA